MKALYIAALLVSLIIICGTVLAIYFHNGWFCLLWMFATSIKITGFKD